MGSFSGFCRAAGGCLVAAVILAAFSHAADLRQVSGIYPHLAYFNDQGECGTGAVVPWADRLWLVTYSPHKPGGSSDKLYELTPDLQLIPHPESVGGTPANRMIHRESNQLLIGPYVIDASANVRVIPPDKMFGRLTGNARHLIEPATKVYYATMEEGFFEVDVRSLEVTELYPDDQQQLSGGNTDASQDDPLDRRRANLPGYHGKGLYSGQSRLIYANNGEPSAEARRRPDIPSGCLAQWSGGDADWQVVCRNQFTEVTGPGGIYGNPHPDTDPVWSIGWDHRSLLLMLLDRGIWSTYRLPKASHTYDGAHGWNTEWPRIRDIGEDDLLMTMHGMLWRFPRTFSRANSAGIAPRSTYLKVIGDFCRWNDRLVFGCDDTAKSEFLNTRRAKGKLEPPGQSHSNLWFVKPELLDQLGPPIGRGAVWVNDPVSKDTASDPYLFAGFARRGVHIVHESPEPVTFRFEIDEVGDGEWQVVREVIVPAGSYRWESFAAGEAGQWIRVRTDRDCDRVTVQFHYANEDSRSGDLGDGWKTENREGEAPAEPETPQLPARQEPRAPDLEDASSRFVFEGVADPTTRNLSGGLIRVRGAELKTLAFAATTIADGEPSGTGYYELDGDLQLKRIEDQAAHDWLINAVPVPTDVLQVDGASVIYVDDEGHRWRLPRGSTAFDQPGLLGPERVDREVVTERDLFNCSGIFYELPARNAGGFAKIRPITTHNLRIKDYCSYRGLLVLTGVVADAKADSPHIVRSDDGKVALWVGVVDDLWKLGKPVGSGGVWNNTSVQAQQKSDPYLMTGFDRKKLRLSHAATAPVAFTVEVDITGEGDWVCYKQVSVAAGEEFVHEFPEAFQAYWVRFVVDKSCEATAWLEYE